MFEEAIRTYKYIIAQKHYAQAGRLRVNIGNILFEKGRYDEAIKQFNMAIDSLPTTTKEVRFKMQRNIALCYINKGKLSEAVNLLEQIMDSSPDPKSAINLIVCLYGLGDKERMKNAFSSLLDMRKSMTSMWSTSAGMGTGASVEDIPALAVATDDEPLDDLRAEQAHKQKEVDMVIINCAQLIAPAIEKDYAVGYDWVVNELSNRNCIDLANQLEVAKALSFMKKKNFDKAIDTLKGFERKDHTMASSASTNLSFLYYLENDVSNAEKYADLALTADGYNAKALVNKGNCLASRGQLEEAKKMYEAALGFDSVDCAEAIYNLGLVYKKLGDMEMAYRSFTKLISILPNDPEVIYQLATLHEQRGSVDVAISLLKQLHSLLHETDPGVAAKLGELYVKKGDENTAYVYFHDSFKLYPANVNVVAWLGTYYVKTMAHDKAVPFFQRAAQLQPQVPHWKMMVGSCFRFSKMLPQAYEVYVDYIRQFPGDVECLKCLEQVCGELDLKEEKQKYSTLLRQLRQSKAAAGDMGGSDEDTNDRRRSGRNDGGYGNGDDSSGSSSGSGSGSSSAGNDTPPPRKGSDKGRQQQRASGGSRGRRAPQRRHQPREEEPDVANLLP
eukprot:TRINITY_DN927_c2_g1_i2.p1 TRINITY_DN927_c2_g1~~TRINITY_DN927_c2_g1_i2.p1  ORF type:complete len:615 (-),score=207.57 TRINITY_DN927_c2_g1_i2:78-1922(-)